MSVDINKEIMYYINSKETVGAIMITGSWGSGKSYLVKQMANELNLSEKQEYAVACVSLFGIDDVDALTKAVNKSVCSVLAMVKSDDEEKGRVDKLFGVLKTLTSKLKEDSKIVDGIDKVINFNIFDFMELSDTVKCVGESKNRRLILVFDDFERCDLPIKILLGVINEYTENRKIKTLIIADEEKIEKEEYLEFKEKVIARTVKLSVDYSEIIKSIVDKYSETAYGYRRFLVDNVEIIIRAFNNSNYKNIRTIKATIHDFERVYDVWKKSKIPSEDLPTIFYQFFAIVAEFKAGNYIRIGKYDVYNIHAKIDSNQVSKENDDAQNKANKEIKDKYLIGTFSNIFISLSKWIVEGDWDEVLFVDEIKKRYCKEVLSDEQKFLIYSFWELDDSIISNGLPIVLNRAYSGEASCDELLSLFKRVHMLTEYGISLPCEIDYFKIENAFDEQMLKVRNGLKNKPVVRTFAENKQLDKDAILINNKIANLDIKMKAWSNYRALISYINGNNTSRYGLKGLVIDVFDDKALEQFICNFKQGDNGRKIEMSRVILSLDVTNKTFSTDGEIFESINNFKKVLGFLNEFIDVERDAISLIILREFKNELEKIIKEFETSKL